MHIILHTLADIFGQWGVIAICVGYKNHEGCKKICPGKPVTGIFQNGRLRIKAKKSNFAILVVETCIIAQMKAIDAHNTN